MYILYVFVGCVAISFAYGEFHFSYVWGFFSFAYNFNILKPTIHRSFQNFYSLIQIINASCSLKEYDIFKSRMHLQK